VIRQSGAVAMSSAPYARFQTARAASIAASDVPAPPFRRDHTKPAAAAAAAPHARTPAAVALSIPDMLTP